MLRNKFVSRVKAIIISLLNLEAMQNQQNF